ncbi:hypothetical protein BH23CHL5_BH23CHL5_15060 [soil metagenome]
MPDLPSFLNTDNHLLWALIGVCIAMIVTLEAVQSAVEGAWPHQRRPSTMLPTERTAQSFWGIVAIALITAGLLLIANLGILLWQELTQTDTQVLGGILVGTSWLLFLLVSIDRFGIRRYMTSIGIAAPLGALALLAGAIILLTLSAIEIWPSEQEFRDALPILTAIMYIR